MINDHVNVTGRLHIVLFDHNGNIKDERDIKNLVVTTGKDFIASRMKDASAAVMSHMAVGTNNTAAAVGDTTLNTELSRAALVSTSVAGNQTQYVATFAAGSGTGALVEAGIFNDPTVGTLLARAVFAVINKGAGDALTITWTITTN